MQEDASRSATYMVPCEDYVHVVEFSPYDCGSAASLLAYGGNQYVVVGTCRFKEEDMEVEGVEFNTLRVFMHGVRVDALAWSPESRLDKLPQTIRFCTAAADRKLRLLTSDLLNFHEVKVIDVGYGVFHGEQCIVVYVVSGAGKQLDNTGGKEVERELLSGSRTLTNKVKNLGKINIWITSTAVME